MSWSRPGSPGPAHGRHPAHPTARCRFGVIRHIRGWAVLLRLSGPLQPWFDKAWKPLEIEAVKLGRRARLAGAAACLVSRGPPGGDEIDCIVGCFPQKEATCLGTPCSWS